MLANSAGGAGPETISGPALLGQLYDLTETGYPLGGGRPTLFRRNTAIPVQPLPASRGVRHACSTPKHGRPVREVPVSRDSTGFRQFAPRVFVVAVAPIKQAHQLQSPAVRRPDSRACLHRPTDSCRPHGQPGNSVLVVPIATSLPVAVTAIRELSSAAIMAQGFGPRDRWRIRSWQSPRTPAKQPPG